MKKMIKILMLLTSLLLIISCSEDGKVVPKKQDPVERDSIILPEIKAEKNVLILYDDVATELNMGKQNAMMLQNLLGHFDVNITTKTGYEYKKNELDAYDTVFYIGSIYNILEYYEGGSKEKKAYKNFYKDIASKDKNIVWINYNLPLLEKFWREHGFANTTFSDKYGMKSSGISHDKYNRIRYKGVELYKGVIPYATPGSDTSHCVNEGNKRYACAVELNTLSILDKQKTDVFAVTYSTLTAQKVETPYITRSGKFWFVGDIPFSYISEEDRYLAFSDVLHDMLEIPHKESHKALMRLEDVDARTNMDDLNAIANFMGSKQIPFSVATIAQYEDPLGIENDGVATTVKLSDSVIGTRLKELYDSGAIDIVQHGTTHQYHKNLNDTVAEISNPYNGLSGDDFEFMRVIKISDDLPYRYVHPVENDSGSWAKDRIQQGKDIFEELGVEAFCWEAPHYMAGPNHYRAIQELYPIQYARMLYFPNEGDLNATKRNKFVGQFFPYLIKKDIYGYTIIPENIHNIEDQPNKGYRTLSSADTIHFAKKLKVVRDAIASFYYHPYLQETELRNVVNGLEAEGYTFVSAPSLFK